MRTLLVPVLLAAVATVGQPGATELDRLQHEHYAYLEGGKFGRAEAVMAQVAAEAAAGDPNAAAYAAVMAARRALEAGDWRAAAETPLPAGADVHAPRVWFARGIGAARSSPAGVGPLMLVARAAVVHLQTRASLDGTSSLAEIEHLAVRAAIAAAQDERDELELLLRHMATLADTRRDTRPPLPLIPVHELAGELWLEVDRYADAVREFRAATEQYPARARAWLGLARAARRVDDRSTATQAYGELTRLWTHADPGRPELQEARTFLAGVAAERAEGQTRITTPR